MRVSRRSLLAGATLGAIGVLGLGAAAQSNAYALAVSRDAGCGCCLEWVGRMRSTGRFRVSVADEADMPSLKQRLGVPIDLASCHTGVVEGLVIEGHVPSEDVLRLLSERPRGMTGIAVPGMPIGSPGMEIAGRGRDGFTVFAFRRDGSRTVFASHAAVG